MENIRLFGQSTVLGGEFDIRRSAPDFQQILVVTSGNGRVWFEEEWHPLRTGNALASPSGSPLAYQSDGSWSISWCIFEDFTFLELRKHPIIRITNSVLWQNVITGLLEETSRPSASPQKLAHWIALLKLEGQQIITEQHEEMLAPLWTDVRRSLSSPWTLDKLAQRAGMNIETLRLHCLREQNMTPVTYLTYLRMNQAADMLRGGFKVEYVSHMVGYSNPFAFSNAFYRTKGIRPSAIKNAVSLK